MYYIYHIDGVKIGCTKNLRRRMREQGFTKWEILETYEDLDTADRRERELQNEYGYVEKYTNITYKQSVSNAKKSPSGFKKGHTPWNKGKSHSSETKKMMSKNRKGVAKSEEFKEKLKLANINKSDEYKKAQSERMKLWWAERKKNNS
jgi:hypothetical protein